MYIHDVDLPAVGAIERSDRAARVHKAPFHGPEGASVPVAAQVPLPCPVCPDHPLEGRRLLQLAESDLPGLHHRAHDPVANRILHEH